QHLSFQSQQTTDSCLEQGGDESIAVTSEGAMRYRPRIKTLLHVVGIATSFVVSMSVSQARLQKPILASNVEVACQGKYASRVKFSPDSQYLFAVESLQSANAVPYIAVWNVKTGTQIGVFSDQSITNSEDIAVSPNNEYLLATNYYNTTILWNFITATEL